MLMRPVSHYGFGCMLALPIVPVSSRHYILNALQVGNMERELRAWTRPEDMQQSRPSFVISPQVRNT